MPEHDRGKHWNRDDEQKPGAPPRTAYEPEGSEGSARSSKTATDPASGEPTGGEVSPSRSSSTDRRGEG